MNNPIISKIYLDTTIKGETVDKKIVNLTGSNTYYITDDFECTTDINSQSFNLDCTNLRKISDITLSNSYKRLL